ncbi:hypothetical protein NM208_g1348 [Fusarium decemcellulare]|uniref:Uncharacterized protein n=1 Tax=Fusarium decemcellulare TaxID=57161 RepID=A0ACC1SWH6_9HYPO|nr:hypothetical protein NM208_g1348 [Fusarium decemcellulare]
MHLPAIAMFIFLVSEGFCKSPRQDTTPQIPKPYALKKNLGIALVGDGTVSSFFPVTGNSSGNAFTLMITAGSSTGGPNAFPHVHRKTYETFYASKGRLQMWGQNNNGFIANTSVQTTRILMPGDFCGIPNNTIHMFQFMEPETQLTSVLAPGSFEEYFFSEAIQHALNLTGPLNETELALWDVYPQRNFTPQYDLVDNKAGPGNWHDGPNELPPDDKNPIWVAKDYGPKWLHSKDGVYQIVSPLLSSRQTNALFAHGTITMSQKPETAEAPRVTSPHATAFMMEEGQLAVMVDGFRTAHLIDGDVFFAPPNTTFSYHAEADFTKFLYISGGGDGIDAMLIADSIEWSSPFYPRGILQNSRRGFMMDNEFILSGYRPASYSYLKSMASIFEVHNETANIWSHLLGSAHFIVVLYSFATLPKVSRLADTLAVALYQLCVAVCFFLSTIYHTFCDHSLPMYRFGNTLDHLGIVLVMWSTGISTAHFTFSCSQHSTLRNIYMTASSLSAIACAVFTLQPKFRTPAFRLVRALAYGLLAICLFLPVIHGCMTFGLERLSDVMHIESLLLLIVIQSTGAAVYAARVPKRWFPGAFDILGQSHTLMHVLVYMGALVRLAGLLLVSERWQDGKMQVTYCAR